MKLIIIDDEYATRNLIRHLLNTKQAGIDTIYEAENFEEAVTKIIQYRPEIIITDMVMPIHDGIQIMDWILEHSPQSKIIAISGHDNFSFVKATIQKGGVDYLLKPLDVNELNKSVQNAVLQYNQELEYHSLKAKNAALPEEEATACHPVILEVQRYIKEHYTKHLR